MDSKKIEAAGHECSATLLHTQAMIEVLTAYFENRIGGGKTIEVSENHMVSYLSQIGENLDKMEKDVSDIIHETWSYPVKLRAVAG